MVHKFITDTCRANRGDMPALQEAMNAIVDSAAMNLKHIPVGTGFKFHFVFTIERPENETPTKHLPQPIRIDAKKLKAKGDIPDELA